MFKKTKPLELMALELKALVEQWFEQYAVNKDKVKAEGVIRR